MFEKLIHSEFLTGFSCKRCNSCCVRSVMASNSRKGDDTTKKTPSPQSETNR